MVHGNVYTVSSHSTLFEAPGFLADYDTIMTGFVKALSLVTVNVIALVPFFFKHKGPVSLKDILWKPFHWAGLFNSLLNPNTPSISLFGSAIELPFKEGVLFPCPKGQDKI